MTHEVTHIDSNTARGAALEQASMGVFANAMLLQTGVGVDTDTVTVGAEVYELDTNSAVTAGNIAVDISGGATAEETIDALVLAINASGKSGVQAVKIDAGTMLLTSKKAVDDSFASVSLAETLTNGTLEAAMIPGRKRETKRAFGREPTAFEVADGRMFFPVDEVLAGLDVDVHVRDVSGIVKAWNGAVIFDGPNKAIVLDNTGAVDWVVGDRVLVNLS